MLTPREPLINPTALQLRSLVLDYLCHNGYTDTARAFAKDSQVRQLDADGDEIMESYASTSDLSEEVLRSVELRERVRFSILSGNVQEAIDLLNEHFPTVLSISGEPVEKEKKQKQPADSMYFAPKSLDPLHLSLNLRILAFIEASRTIPLKYPQDNDSTPHGSPILHAQVDDHDENVHASVNRHQTDLLAKAQKLYAAVNALNPKDREKYDKELSNVAGLLAYRIPEMSPMARYLTQDRREAVAAQINSAILHLTGQNIISDLELYTRYTTTIWSFINDLHIKPPSLPTRPPGFSVPPSNAFRIALPSMGSTRQEEAPPEGVPLFDLRFFLDSKS